MPAGSPGYLGTQDDVILPRVGAFVLDYVISLIVALVVGFGIGAAFGSNGAVFLGVLLGLVGYYVVLEGAFGQTVGKRLAGVIVVSRDGSPIGYRQAAVRNLLRVVDAFFNYAVGLVVMLVTDDCQRVGDIVADTLVVRARR